MLVTSIDDIREHLATARTIAVLGAHHEAQKPAYYVPAYLHRVGYHIIPVNPAFAGETLFGEIVRPSLAGVVCDMVDIFRRPEALPGHLDEILALTPRPRTIWLQLGIVNRAFTDRLVAEGLDVIEDRCTYADHRLFGLPKKVPT
jgi:predicted CoA-binding protein